MSSIAQFEGEILITRPVDVVFDYAAGQPASARAAGHTPGQATGAGDLDGHEAAIGGHRRSSIDRAERTITFTTMNVRIAVLASPSMPAESFRIAGMAAAFTVR